MSINRMKHLAGLCEAIMNEELTSTQLERYCERYLEGIQKEQKMISTSNKDVTWEMAHDPMYDLMSDAPKKDNSSASTQIYLAIENVIDSRDELLAAYEKLIALMEAV